MNYGMLASKSCLLTNIVNQLHEPYKKNNIADRLSRHLTKGTPKEALKAYLIQVKKWRSDQPSTISMTVMWSNRMVINLKHLARYGMVLKALLQKNVKKKLSCNRSHSAYTQPPSGQHLFRNSFFQ